MATRSPNTVPGGSLWKPLEFSDGEDNRFDQWWRLDTIPELHLHVVGYHHSRAPLDKTYCLYEMGAYASVEEALDDWCRADLYQLIDQAYQNAVLNDADNVQALSTMAVDAWTDDLRDYDADIGEYARHRVKEAAEVWRADHN